MRYINIGNLIHKVTNNKNTKLLDLPLLGLHIEKKFIPSVANIIGTDMSKYQIIRKWQFAYTGMQVGRDESLHIALYDKDAPALITPAYTIFEVNNTSEIIPEYLMLYLRRPESDRLGWFYSDSSVRSNLDWDRFCSIEIPIPSLEHQREIVTKYNQINEAIAIKERLNNNLEQQADSIFYSFFIDDVNEEFIKTNLGNICKCELGGTPSRDIEEYWGGNIAWINSGKVNDFRITCPSEFITELGLKKSATKLMPPKTVVIAITGATLGQVSILEIFAAANQSVIGILENKTIPYEYIYPYIKYKLQLLLTYQTGGAQQHINKQNVENLEIDIPSDKYMSKYKDTVKPIYKAISNNCITIDKMNTLKNTLLPKLMLESGESSSDKLSFTEL